jgi:hypothetical protein
MAERRSNRQKWGDRQNTFWNEEHERNGMKHCDVPVPPNRVENAVDEERQCKKPLCFQAAVFMPK